MNPKLVSWPQPYQRRKFPCWQPSHTLTLPKTNLAHNQPLRQVIHIYPPKIAKMDFYLGKSYLQHAPHPQRSPLKYFVQAHFKIYSAMQER